MSLRTRFTLLTCSLLGAVFLIFFTAFYWLEREHLHRLGDQTRVDAVKKFARVCADASLSKDDIFVMNYIKELGADEQVLWAMFVAADGRVRMHSDLAQRGARLSGPADRRALAAPSIARQTYESAAGPVLEFSSPVMAAGGRIGAARIAYSQAKAQASTGALLERALKRLVLAGILALIGAIAAAYYAAGTLVEPIRRLLRGAQRIGAGDLTARVHIEDGGEIGRLAHKFNWMARRLAELDEVRDTIVAGVSHDIRNPISAIIMNTSYLMSGQVPQDKHEMMLGLINTSAQRLLFLVNNILDAAKMKEVRIEYAMSPVPPKRIVDEACTLYWIQARNRGISLRPALPADLPLIKVDENMVHRVFNNILSNAVKFTGDKGQIVIGASWEPDGRWVTFSVSDTGSGIAKEDLPKLFQRFSTLTRRDERLGKNQGAGLGLHIAKTIVEDHGGRIWVESEAGRGTTFFWTLPAAQDASLADPAPGAAR